MPEPAFVVEDYSFWFKLPSGERRLALDNVSFSVTKGSFVLILGESGSGKSTLALNLVGIYPHYFGGFNEGRILVNHPTKGLVNRRELDRGERFKTVNRLFQNPEDQIVTLTVEEEIAFALENYLVPPAEIRPRVAMALDLVGLQGFKDRSTLKLSGGEKQRVALAAMLAMEPSVLILDEPTSNLDPAGTEEVPEAVRLVRERVDITLVIVEHEVDRVFHLVDEVLLVDGLAVHGPEAPRKFLAKRGMQVRDDMGLWIPQASEVSLELARRGVSLTRTHLTGEELVDDLGAAGARGPAAPSPETNAAPRRLVASPESVIKVREVGFSYPSKSDVLRDIDLDIHKHELLAIVGQNGSGKSTLASCLTGLFAPTSGTVTVDAVLAHLLFRANQLVPAETLVDEIWGEEPPERARNIIQTYISHLRKALGHDRIQGHAPGYCLRLDSSELDAARFDALLREAKKTLPMDPNIAVGTLDDALALWRGPALADLGAQPSLLAEAARLDELRLEAQERRLEGLLATGTQARAIGELETLLARHPWRESLWGLLMLAYYREGRQADALGAYQRAREMLADELGIDPSPELMRLHERVLNQDPGLDLRGEQLRGYRLLERLQRLRGPEGAK